ncbi:hypothetical protein [Brevundimonas sp.]|uniref:hypothetical protein n=1 Tax=Brevundimonas sp. TaxID=1871086 RepID=UPI00273086E6|nr:hypothetical protein [Brevundimonas sp.]MDP1912191.1 hypothetical protein [Brevundimonas sp.]
MSQVLIHQFLAELDRLKKVGGKRRESVVREAFKDLLKGWGRQHELVFIPEYKLDSATRDTRFVDGALLHQLRVPFGYWEAKDPTIREKFDTYRFAEHKEKVIALLGRVAAVSVETVRIVAAMKAAAR